MMQASRDSFTALLLRLVAATALTWIASARADPRDVDATQAGLEQSDEDASNVANNGVDITRPQNSFEWRLLNQPSSSDSSRRDRAVMTLRLNNRFPLERGWRLATLAQLPIVSETTTQFDPAQSANASGVGDGAIQGILSRAIDARWAFGFGARLVAPTAEEGLGGGKWQIMPGAGIRYSLTELGPDSSIVPSMRYAISVAGPASRRRISEAQIAPTINVNLPGPWFVTLYPSYDIRINYGGPRAGQTGRLFLPFDAMIGVKMTNNLQISLEVGVPIVKDYPVYDFKTEARVRVSY